MLGARVRTILDLVPVVVFFIGYKWFGLFNATAALIICTLAILIVHYAVERRIAMAPLITAIIVTLLGSLTLWLHNETFIKMKLTLIDLVFAAILLAGCMRGKGLLRYVLGTAFTLNEQGWLLLSRRWGFFFLFLAILNECVWRNFSTDIWVNFKVFGSMGLTMLFAVAQVGLMQRYTQGE